MTRWARGSAISFPLLAGCSSVADIFGVSSSSDISSLTSQPAGGLSEAVASSGTLWPVSFASALFLLAAIPAFFILGRKEYMGLLAVGVLLAVSPMIIFKIMDHLVVPIALLTGLAGLGVTVFFIGRLWDRRRMRVRAQEVAEQLTCSDSPDSLSDVDAAEAVLSITESQ